MSKQKETPPEPRPSGALATVHDIREAAAGEKFVAWLSSGLGALAAVLGIVGALIGGSWFIIDRAEAQGAKAAAASMDAAVVAGAQGVKASAAVAEELHAHIEEEKRDKAEQRRRLDRQDRILERQDQKSDAILMGLGLRNPAPAPKPESTGR